MKQFAKTPAQQQALKLLQSPARHILLFGGSRSGKTFILIYALLVRALKAPGSRHAVLRFHGNGAIMPSGLTHCLKWRQWLSRDCRSIM